MTTTQTQTVTGERAMDYCNNDMLFKIIIIGDAGAGKSCLLLRYADDEFSDCYISTIGVDFKIRTVTLEEKIIKLNMWDTAGQERFKTITSTFYRGAHGVMVVFDLTDMESFTNVLGWISEIEKYGGGHVAKLLVGNKSDIKHKRVVTYESAQALATMFGMKYIETSAKTSTNVDQAFMAMTATIKENCDAGAFINPQGTRIVPLASGRNVDHAARWPCIC